MQMRTFLATALAAALLAGCGSADEETVAPKVPRRTAQSENGIYKDPARDPLGAIPVTVSADALTLGTAVGPNGAVTAKTNEFALADTVHATFPLAGRPPGAKVTVFWTYQDGRSHHEERGTLPAGEFADYQFDRAKGMQPGKYNVEVQLNDRPIGISDFVVR